MNAHEWKVDFELLLVCKLFITETFPSKANSPVHSSVDGITGIDLMMCMKQACQALKGITDLSLTKGFVPFAY